MKTIDLKSIIEAKGLDTAIVAQQLFPTNQYSRLALNRVMAGKAELDATQISKLSLLANMTIDQLYGTVWAVDSQKGIHKFTNGEFIAELDTNTWVTKIFHKRSMIHESVIHSSSVPLSKYIETLNQLINENN